MPEFANIMPLLRDEYASLLSAMKSANWTVTDLIRESAKGGNGKFNPVTFGEFEEVEGQRVSTEPILINGDNLCSA